MTRVWNPKVAGFFCLPPLRFALEITCLTLWYSQQQSGMSLKLSTRIHLASKTRMLVSLPPSAPVIDWLIDWLTDWLFMWGETDVSEPRPSLAYCSSLGWIWSWEPWLWWCRLGITPYSSTRTLWQSYQQRHLERVGGMDEGMRISRIQYLWYVNGFVNMSQNLTTWDFRLYFPSEGRCAAGFYRP
jgi:hypothetical protein